MNAARKSLSHLCWSNAWPDTWAMRSACPNCGRLIEGREDFCSACGAFLGWEDKGSAESQLYQRPPAPPDDRRAGVQLRIDNDLIAVAPGSSESTTCTVKNLGTQVEEFRLVVTGPGWIIVQPAALRVYPGQEATAAVQAAPPRDPSSLAGVTPFQVTATSTVHSQVSSSVAGRADVGAFYELVAELVPTSSTGRGTTRHHIRLGNRGNTAVRAALNPTDVADRLRLGVPAVADVAAGSVTEVPISVRASLRWFGRPEPKSFSVLVDAPKPMAPTRVSGTRTVLPVFPRWVLRAIPLVVVAAAAAILIPKLKSPAAPAHASSSSPATSSSPASHSASPTASPTPSPVPLTPLAQSSQVTWVTNPGAGTPTTSSSTACQPATITTPTQGVVFSVQTAALEDGNAAAALETLPPYQPGASISGTFMMAATSAGEHFRADIGFCSGTTAGSQMQYQVTAGSQSAGPTTFTSGQLWPVDLALPTGTTQITLTVTNTQPNQAAVIWVDPIVEAGSATLPSF